MKCGNWKEKKRKAKTLVVGMFCSATLILYVATNSQGFIDFWDALHYRLTEFDPYLSHDVQDTKLLLWTRKNRKSEVYLNMSSMANNVVFNM